MFDRQQLIHSWLKTVQVAFHPRYRNDVLDQAVAGLSRAFSKANHGVQRRPTSETDLLITTAPFGKPLDWRDALIFTARREFDIDRNPAVITMVHLPPEKFQEQLENMEQGLGREEPRAEDFQYAGLADNAHRVIFEQGRRGGPILALERVIQAQVKSVRVILVVGDERPEQAYTFNLVGAHPRATMEDPGKFYEEIMLRLVTAVSTHEITDHKSVKGDIPPSMWRGLDAVEAMKTASRKLGQRNFFTRMVRIEDLVNVPAVSDVVSSQYSEGCFATWAPEISGLITTVTGSARPVQKDQITEEDLAVIVGVREDGQGALVRHVAEKKNDPPSSEAVEMYAMDRPLPRISFAGHRVPVIRSKLHGHRGVASFNPEVVEHVPLDLPYYHLPVSCATQAQAQGIQEAFAKSTALQKPEDPRKIVFTVLPGHGVVIAEKWVPGKASFQVMWEAMEDGDLRIDNYVPQGWHSYVDCGETSLLQEGADAVIVG